MNWNVFFTPGHPHPEGLEEIAEIQLEGEKKHDILKNARKQAGRRKKQ